MKYRIDLSKQGQKIATKGLINKGYLLIEENLRIGKSEFDLIVKKDSQIFVVEVKSRTNQLNGSPEEAVDKNKFNKFENNYYFIANKFNVSEVHYIICSVTINNTSNKARVKLIHVQ